MVWYGMVWYGMVSESWGGWGHRWSASSGPLWFVGVGVRFSCCVCVRVGGLEGVGELKVIGVRVYCDECWELLEGLLRDVLLEVGVPSLCLELLDGLSVGEDRVVEVLHGTAEGVLGDEGLAVRVN